MGRAKLTACVIARNEGRNIGDCLNSLDFADELVVVDSGSTDDTAGIARRLGATVIYHPFQGHVQQKNFAVAQAHNDWVISLDCDERISGELRTAILSVLEKKNACDGYRIRRRTFYIDRWVRHGGWYPDWQLRLFRRSRARWGGVNPHDRIELDGAAGTLEGDILHHSFPSVRSHIDTINNFSGIQARGLFQQGKTSLLAPRMLFKTLSKFLEMYVFKQGFLDGRNGLIISVFSAYATFAKYAKLYELTKKGWDGKYDEK